jgi:hypothetical protein
MRNEASETAWEYKYGLTASSPPSRRSCFQTLLPPAKVIWRRENPSTAATRKIRLQHAHTCRNVPEWRAIRMCVLNSTIVPGGVWAPQIVVACSVAQRERESGQLGRKEIIGRHNLDSALSTQNPFEQQVCCRLRCYGTAVGNVEVSSSNRSSLCIC